MQIPSLGMFCFIRYVYVYLNLNVCLYILYYFRVSDCTFLKRCSCDRASTIHIPVLVIQIPIFLYTYYFNTLQVMVASRTPRWDITTRGCTFMYSRTFSVLNSHGLTLLVPPGLSPFYHLLRLTVHKRLARVTEK